MILSNVNHGEWIKYFVLQKKFLLALLSINSIGIIVTTIFDTLRVFVVILAVRIVLFISLVYLFINCNYYIFRYGMQSFVVWYKTIHSFISCLSFVILLHSTEETADESKRMN